MCRVTFLTEKIIVKGSREEIYCANQAALSGENPDLVDYLAMNSALGLYA